MRKTLLLIIAAILPIMIKAQSVPTGITPYIFYKVWENMKGEWYEPSQLNKAEALLYKAGYRKVGKFEQSIGYDLVYAKACNVIMDKEGFVKSASPNEEFGFSSYIRVGPGVGMDWSMSVTFLSQKGTDAFIELLNKSDYKFYDGGESPAWVRRTDGWYFMQGDKSFSVSDVIGGEDLIVE